MSVATLSNPNSAAIPTTARRLRILVSILNWNKAEQTAECLDSLQGEFLATPADITVLVIDNGSADADYAALQESIRSRNAMLKRMPSNLGFTGGHNIAIEEAIRENYDYIWLLNNDATVEPGTMRELLSVIEREDRCGAVSPILRDVDDGSIARCINTHDWAMRTSNRILSIETGRQVQQERPESVWIDGTAILLRVKALREVGPLDNRLFAYYDDNDISARLSSKGWFNRCAFDATVLHENRKSFDNFPPYLSYLLARNEMLFWYTNTPAPHRRMLWLKLIDKALYDVNRYYFKKGRAVQGDAALLGIYDFMRGRFGAPVTDRKVPFFMRMASRLSAVRYDRK